MATSENKSVMDRVGIWTSSICALHCLLLPILIPLVPFVSASFFAQDWFEKTILTLSMIVGFWALLFGFYRYHRQLYPIYSLLLGGLIYWNKDMFGEAYEPFTIGLGALLIVAAHVANIRLCKSCDTCHDCESSQQPNQ
ncbi:MULTISPECIES: MerC domain-containing protein [Alteromonadaceae]|uniref:MerC domain-containing protein n=1 Tax=Alteromonadaceae TaxID=72275 RepID=UPI001C090ED4|nr:MULTISPECIES: MerC domain-containing protein [Aliiglaciecola]MBU2878500.1 MerC domain-containing protein [Aliiglaciecola lipolytica]MDO6709684.1 MerC domain-containing protein [Aliiglaciecola sp. 2_MG-2023]MDO6750774.1 MerC domain-containing protein [Aliiglaciecola sp. 1_MG-2023]